MNSIQKLVAVLSLVVIVAACMLFFYGKLEKDVMNWIVLAATIAWFGTATLWIGRSDKTIAADDS
jgi:hypothetical protein